VFEAFSFRRELIECPQLAIDISPCRLFPEHCNPRPAVLMIGQSILHYSILGRMDAACREVDPVPRNSRQRPNTAT
jgi:hypothetical protein